MSSRVPHSREGRCVLISEFWRNNFPGVRVEMLSLFQLGPCVWGQLCDGEKVRQEATRDPDKPMSR